MNKYLSWVLLFLGTLFTPIHQGEAATLVNIIDFPLNTSAADTQSGNTIDYVYEHVFQELDVTGLTLNSATLQLKHLGNQDLGPTAEIWFALSGSGTLIGRLGESNSAERTDPWILPASVLSEIESENPWKFKVALSEQTSFNGERLALLQSKLEMDYTRTLPPPTTTPTVPEPSSFVLLTYGLLALLKLRRVSLD
jgi:hypothetical protein